MSKICVLNTMKKEGCDIMKDIKIAILGGDKRQKYLKDYLSEKFTVKTFALDNSENDISNYINFDVYIFPLPISRDNIHLNANLTSKKYKLCDIIKKLPHKSLILGGNISDEVENMFQDMKVIDYYKREQLALLNAVPTALCKSQIIFQKLGQQNAQTLVHL